MDNLRGSVLMILAMAGFALEDMFIKLLADSLPIGQILWMLGAGGAVVFGLLIKLQRRPLLSGDAFHPAVLWRNLGEIIAAAGYITAIALTPLSSASAILQATSLAVTLGAALFMGEQVGWRRWSAICIGFLGVLMVIRPGLDGFQPASLFAVLGVVGLAIRDLATRAAPRSVSSMQLSAYAFIMLIPTGLTMLAFSGGATMPARGDVGYMVATLVFSVAGYWAIVAAMRVGEVSFVTPFRYTRLLFALVIGITVFGERPDWMTYAGAALIIASGLYTILRERRLARKAARRAAAETPV